jgi:hypothetical protein
MTTASKVTVLVLGPMEQLVNGVVTVEARTKKVKAVVRDMVDQIMAEPGWRGPEVDVLSPEDRENAVLIPAILDLIEKADLVIIDLTGNKVNVAYEAAIVHSLGLPHICVTEEETPPFYFRPALYIPFFRAGEKFEQDLASHRALRERLKSFLTAKEEVAAATFTANELTRYYGLPVVDIAGPSGLAAGYYRNAIWRLFRSNGLLDGECQISWTTKPPDGQTRVETARRRIKYLVSVLPPGGLGQKYIDDNKALEDALKRLGYRLQDITIPKRDGEERDMRNFGGKLLVHDTAEADRTSVVEPGILIDMPATLYALQFSPRVRRLNAQMTALPVVETLKQRLLTQMQESFKHNLDYQFRMEPDAGMAPPFRFVAIGQLEDTLKQLVRPSR